LNKQTNSVLPISGIDKVYVLSVKTFSDRITHISNELSKHNIDFEFIFDFDVDDIKEQDLAKFSPSNMKLAHKSLVLKNICTWEKIVQNNIGRALILEDDAILNEDFREKIQAIIKAADELPPGYLIFLGGADTKLPADFLNHPSPLVPRRITTADGLIIDHTIAKRRLEWLKKNKITLPADGLMCKIDEDIKLPHYWPKQAIVQQASCTGQFKTTLDSSRSKHSLLYIKLRYNWHKFKNQSLKRWLKNI
jgi:glycosyl transferase, family 25